MKTHSGLTMVFALVSMILAPRDSGFAQSTEGRWVLGFQAGGNVWINDYNKALIGSGGDLMLRYGVSEMFSAGFLAGYEELKSEQSPIPGGPSYLKAHAIPASGVIWVHFGSGSIINPYVYAGIGAMIYKTLDWNGVYYPNSEYQSSIHLPFGVGLEYFPSKNVSIVGDVGYRITDDYPDALKMGDLDGYVTARLGVNLYLGTSHADAEAQRVKDADARRVKELADAEARRVKQQADADAEARRVKELAGAEARRIKDSTDAAALRTKELSDAEARRLAAQKGRDTTIIVLEKGKTVVLRGINFEFNKATLTKDSEIILQRALRALRASPDLSVLIVGHTDNVGSAAYNKKLSLRRAEAVKSWMVKRGIPAKRLSAAGKGFDEPIDTNNTEDGRANNRRMEFRVLE